LLRAWSIRVLGVDEAYRTVIRQALDDDDPVLALALNCAQWVNIGHAE
jgi:hypothetical protein